MFDAALKTRLYLSLSVYSPPALTHSGTALRRLNALVSGAHAAAAAARGPRTTGWSGPRSRSVMRCSVGVVGSLRHPSSQGLPRLELARPPLHHASFATALVHWRQAFRRDGFGFFFWHPQVPPLLTVHVHNCSIVSTRYA